MIDAARHHWAVRQGRARKRPRKAIGLVWHYIGAGAFRNARDATAPDAPHAGMDTADWVLWRWETGRMGLAGCNYLITQQGEIIEVVPPDLIANHAKSVSKPHYNRWWERDPDTANQFKWWHERWPMGGNPRKAWPDLWTGSAALNTHTIGVELVAMRGDILSQAMVLAMDTLADALVAINKLDKKARMLTHSDVDPIRRPNYDLDFAQFWTLRTSGLISG